MIFRSEKYIIFVINICMHSLQKSYSVFSTCMVPTIQGVIHCDAYAVSIAICRHAEVRLGSVSAYNSMFSGQ